jgi:hypothetical protein
VLLAQGRHNRDSGVLFSGTISVCTRKFGYLRILRQQNPQALLIISHSGLVEALLLIRDFGFVGTSDHFPTGLGVAVAQV